MGVKVYVSGISGNKEVKKRQQRVLMILDSRSIKYEVVDIAEPGKESDKDFMQTNATASGATVSDTKPRNPLPPQLFNGEQYCGDYDLFDMANEVDELEKFLKLAPDENAPKQVSTAEVTLGNGELKAPVGDTEKAQPEVQNETPSEATEATKETTEATKETTNETPEVVAAEASDEAPAKAPDAEATDASNNASAEPVTENKIEESSEKHSGAAEKQSEVSSEEVVENGAVGDNEQPAEADVAA